MTVYTDNTNAGVDIDLEPDAPKTKWLLEQGYIGVKKPTKAQVDRGRNATSVPASEDPTLAINREKPVGVNEIEPHVANDGDVEGTEVVHGKNMGLEAEQVAPTGPDAKVRTHKNAGLDASVSDDEGASLKSAIDKEQGQPPLPGKGKPAAEVPDTSLKDAIDKEQPTSTVGRPA